MDQWQRTCFLYWKIITEHGKLSVACGIVIRDSNPHLAVKLAGWPWSLSHHKPPHRAAWRMRQSWGKSTFMPPLSAIEEDGEGGVTNICWVEPLVHLTWSCLLWLMVASQNLFAHIFLNIFHLGTFNRRRGRPETFCLLSRDSTSVVLSFPTEINQLFLVLEKQIPIP